MPSLAPRRIDRSMQAPAAEGAGTRRRGGAVVLAAGAVLLAGPCVVAFFTGGYFAQARTTAGAAAWLLAAVALLARARTRARTRGRAHARGSAPSPPRSLSRARALALCGLAGLTAWTAASMTWAPIRGDAYGATQIAALYLGAMLAAALLLDAARLRAAVEPALGLGVAIVIGYGLSERLLPGLLQFARSVSAQGRLEQPLTYWNAMGELAALGLVLSARIAGDERRPGPLRALAAAAGPLLGLGLYVSFSRGALFAAAAGLLALTVALPRLGQLRSTLLVLAGAVVVSAAAAPFGAVTNLQGSLADREGQGAIVIAVLLAVMALVAGLQHRLSRRPGRRPLPLPRRAGWIAVSLICGGLAVAIAFGAKERSGVPISGGANRLVSLQSNRYAYWRVALRAFAHAPVVGVGAGGWSVWWLRDRPYPDGAQNAHSLELETMAELGLVGLALLAAWLAGIGWSGRLAYRADPLAAAGPIAVFTTWLAHTPLDWDWQMPAVTLVAMIAAGALVSARSEAARPATVSSRARPELQPS